MNDNNSNNNVFDDKITKIIFKDWGNKRGRKPPLSLLPFAVVSRN
jgi:hypothetical protein